jgi:hypothetical protein
MNPLTIVISVVVLLLVGMLIYWWLHDANTLQGIQNGQTSSKIPYTSLTTNGTGVPSVKYGFMLMTGIIDMDNRKLYLDVWEPVLLLEMEM